MHFGKMSLCTEIIFKKKMHPPLFIPSMLAHFSLFQVHGITLFSFAVPLLFIVLLSVRLSFCRSSIRDFFLNVQFVFSYFS